MTHPVDWFRFRETNVPERAKVPSTARGGAMLFAALGQIAHALRQLRPRLSDTQQCIPLYFVGDCRSHLPHLFGVAFVFRLLGGEVFLTRHPQIPSPAFDIPSTRSLRLRLMARAKRQASVGKRPRITSYDQ
jgi:hypothetical protein